MESMPRHGIGSELRAQAGSRTRTVTLPEADMHRKTTANRVEILEGKVDRLDQLPARIHSLQAQISQFRKDASVKFSAGDPETLRERLRPATSTHSMFARASYSGCFTPYHILASSRTRRG